MLSKISSFQIHDGILHYPRIRQYLIFYKYIENLNHSSLIKKKRVLLQTKDCMIKQNILVE